MSRTRQPQIHQRPQHTALPPLLKQWGGDGTAHGGMIFVDVRPIAPNF